MKVPKYETMAKRTFEEAIREFKKELSEIVAEEAASYIGNITSIPGYRELGSLEYLQEELCELFDQLRDEWLNS